MCGPPYASATHQPSPCPSSGIALVEGKKGRAGWWVENTSVHQAGPACCVPPRCCPPTPQQSSEGPPGGDLGHNRLPTQTPSYPCRGHPAPPRHCYAIAGGVYVSCTAQHHADDVLHPLLPAGHRAPQTKEPAQGAHGELAVSKGDLWWGLLPELVQPLLQTVSARDPQ